MKNKRIVIKLGSSLLTGEDGALQPEMCAGYSKLISELWKAGARPILVSSGAIAAGFGALGYKERPQTVKARQASAAVGQGRLIHEYEKAFREFEIVSAQLLLSRKDFTSRMRYNNALNTLEFLLEKGVVPIINENDAIAVEESESNDNDTLAALVAGLVQADNLILLTDIDGVYTANPRQDTSAERIPVVKEFSSELFDLADDKGSKVGTGGMLSKLKSARISTALGVEVFIGKADINISEDLLSVINGAGKGTYFKFKARTNLRRKKQWIAFHSEVSGNIVIDSGAVKALTEHSKSLLPVGVRFVEGDFEDGDVVDVSSLEGEVIGKGIVSCSAGLLRKVKGLSSEDVTEKIDRQFDEVINRDNWVAFSMEL